MFLREAVTVHWSSVTTQPFGVKLVFTGKIIPEKPTSPQPHTHITHARTLYLCARVLAFTLSVFLLTFVTESAMLHASEP